MFETIQKLLVLQDRDRNIHRVGAELANIEPERQALKEKSSSANAALDGARLKVKTLDSKRKDLELEIEGKKQLIVKYANQQLETRKNEEYRALGHQIDQCKEAIFKTEDQILGLMEQSELAQKEVGQATAAANEARKALDQQIAQLDAREANLKKELAGLQADRGQLAAAVNESARLRYERLLHNKGDNVLVGVQHSVCGGCHMKLPPQTLVSCQGGKELVSCGNCGRLLYYTPEMDLAVVD